MHRPRSYVVSLRPAAESLVIVVVLALVIRGWLVQNFIVSSGSMADTLRGPHRQWTCPDCGQTMALGTFRRPISSRVACPYCGFPEIDPTDTADQSGDRILVHKAAFATRPPRRWEIVAFRSPEPPHDVTIKRVVALPGESVQIIDGDVHIDGQIARKSIELQRRMWVPVHSLRSQPEVAEGWRGERPDSRWRRQGGELVFDSTVSIPENNRLDWLVYRNLRRARDASSERFVERPIVDHLAYNQHRFRREEHYRPVRDLAVRGWLTASGPGRLVFLATDGQHRFECEINLRDRRAELRHGDHRVAVAVLPDNALTAETLVEFSLVDRQVLFALSEAPLFPAYHFLPADRPVQPTTRPFAIAALGSQVRLTGLTVLRDVYYTDVFASGPSWAIDVPYQLGSDEVFVVGDNSPLSDDSRTWSAGPGLSTELLVGKPFFIYFPSRWGHIGRYQLQVPDLARMNYIR